MPIVEPNNNHPIHEDSDDEEEYEPTDEELTEAIQQFRRSKDHQPAPAPQKSVQLSGYDFKQRQKQQDMEDRMEPDSGFNVSGILGNRMVLVVIMAVIIIGVGFAAMQLRSRYGSGKTENTVSTTEVQGVAPVQTNSCATKVVSREQKSDTVNGDYCQVNFDNGTTYLKLGSCNDPDAYVVGSTWSQACP
jgi:hypothetical protein